MVNLECLANNIDKGKGLERKRVILTGYLYAYRVYLWKTISSVLYIRLNISYIWEFLSENRLSENGRIIRVGAGALELPHSFLFSLTDEL